MADSLANGLGEANDKGATVATRTCVQPCACLRHYTVANDFEEANHKNAAREEKQRNVPGFTWEKFRGLALLSRSANMEANTPAGGEDKGQIG